MQTGVLNLDMVLGGGIPEGDVMLVVGSPGAGKTTLSLQMAFHAADCGQNVLYISTLSEPATRILNHFRRFSFYDESLIGKRLFLLSIYPLIKQGVAQTLDALLRAVQEHQAALAIIDGLMTFRDMHPDVPEFRSFLYELGAHLSALGCTTLVTSIGREDPEHSYLPEYTMVDGIIELGTRNLGTRTLRTLRVVKVRGLAPLLGIHSLRIDDDGIALFPRIESVYSPRDAGTGPDRVPTGLAELDQMVGGGLPASSITLLTGALGAGKTLACLHYLAEGVRRGERALMVGFRESPRQLIDKARAFGMDLETPTREGALSILHFPQVDLDVDEVTWEIQREVEHLAPRRLAMDSIAELEYSIVDDGRRRGYEAGLAGMLRNSEVTSLVTREIAQLVGPELDFADAPLAILAENLILLRHVEFRGELYRIISVVKMRDTAHDHSIRQYTITDQGLGILAKLDSAEGVLTGIARLTSWEREKRGAG